MRHRSRPAAVERIEKEKVSRDATPGFSEGGKVFHDSAAEFALAGRVVTRRVERVAEDVFHLIGVHHAHPLSPGVRARSLSCTVITSWNSNITPPFLLIRSDHLREMVVVDVHPVLGKLLGEIIGRTGKVVICRAHHNYIFVPFYCFTNRITSDNVANHFLIQVAVLDVIPIGVLRHQVDNQLWKVKEDNY